MGIVINAVARFEARRNKPKQDTRKDTELTQKELRVKRMKKNLRKDSDDHVGV